jgi:hypothetical protein
MLHVPCGSNLERTRIIRRNFRPIDHLFRRTYYTTIGLKGACMRVLARCVGFITIIWFSAFVSTNAETCAICHPCATWATRRMSCSRSCTGSLVSISRQVSIWVVRNRATSRFPVCVSSTNTIRRSPGRLWRLTNWRASRRSNAEEIVVSGTASASVSFRRFQSPGSAIIASSPTSLTCRFA